MVITSLHHREVSTALNFDARAGSTFRSCKIRSQLATLPPRFRSVLFPDPEGRAVLERASGKLSFQAGEFSATYGGAGGPYEGVFDAVVTSFFVDTAPNVVQVSCSRAENRSFSFLPLAHFWCSMGVRFRALRRDAYVRGARMHSTLSQHCKVDLVYPSPAIYRVLKCGAPTPLAAGRNPIPPPLLVRHHFSALPPVHPRPTPPPPPRHPHRRNSTSPRSAAP